MIREVMGELIPSVKKYVKRKGNIMLDHEWLEEFAQAGRKMREVPSYLV